MGGRVQLQWRGSFLLGGARACQYWPCEESIVRIRVKLVTFWGLKFVGGLVDTWATRLLKKNSKCLATLL